MFTVKAAVLLAALSAQSCHANGGFRARGRDLGVSFFTYEPKTSVTDHAAIDMDEKEIEDELNKRTSVGFSNARTIYNHGAHSRSYASLSLVLPVEEDIAYGTEVTGKSKSGAIISGTVEKNVEKGNDILWFLYSVSDVIGHHVDCQVGGSQNPITDGCLAENGSITIGGKDMQYTYDMTSDNRNGRRFNKFSTEAEDKNVLCEYGCPYEDFKSYYDYYGDYAYSDKIISAAFDGVKTSFTNGNQDFTGMNRPGRGAAIRIATVHLSLWMYIIREMEVALDACVDNCGSSGKCDPDNVHGWDQSVAFYTGSLEQGNGGYLMYSLADQMCQLYGVCGFEGDEKAGTAFMNYEILKLFNQGQNALMKGKCDTARTKKEKIVRLMSVPLVQATLRAAHVLDNAGVSANQEKNAEAAGYAGTILPLVNKCSTADADIIYNNLKIDLTNKDSGKVNYKDVKQALERNYDCLGITCKNVGGLIDSSKGSYIDGAGPCTFASNINNAPSRGKNGKVKKSGSGAASVVAAFMMFLIAALAAGLGYTYYKNQRALKNITANSDVEFKDNVEDQTPTNEVIDDGSKQGEFT